MYTVIPSRLREYNFEPFDQRTLRAAWNASRFLTGQGYASKCIVKSKVTGRIILSVIYDGSAFIEESIANKIPYYFNPKKIKL